MKKTVLLLFLCCSFCLPGQELQSPSEFLGYELGSEFTRHHRVVEYYQYLARTAPDRVQLQDYGETNEGRILLLAYLSSAANMDKLEKIRKEHLESTEGKGTAEKAIVWLSYNVHGNESVSTEASMQTIYDLLTSKKEYLENTVVIIDPCINPDGRDRYVNWYRQYKSSPYNVDPNSKEHREGWWSGRSNHYMFDLNRDWAWLTQRESQLRLPMYNQWMPHIHVDFHEQSMNSPYYFAPAAEPYHEVITDFQREFQQTIGKNHANYFDKEGWFYFTKERFDLFYPSYGDTYPTYNGAIGMTYEQGGSGRAGLGVITANGDTLTLKDRIEHHVTTGLSTVEMASEHANRLNTEFRKFYRSKNYKYKSYVLKGDEDKIKSLTNLLDKHEIEYGFADASSAKGFRYQTGKSGSIALDGQSLVISSNQKKGTLVKVLFEPNAKLSDSLTYDITAWSLPYAYGLDALASTSLISATNDHNTDPIQNSITDNAYAYLVSWKGMADARFLADLLKEGIRVRYAHKPFRLDGKKYERGTLIITREDNSTLVNFVSTIRKYADKHNRSVKETSTGYVESGKDFGSGYVQMIPETKVGVLMGDPTSTLRYGEIWHFMEQQLGYPFSALDSDYIDNIDLDNYQVLVLPDGYGYRRLMKNGFLEKLNTWVTGGGKLIAMGQSIKSFEGVEDFSVTFKESNNENENGEDEVQSYDETPRERMKNQITGAIFKAKVDPTNPLAYGYGNTYFTLKLGTDSYDYLPSGTAVYLDKETKPVAGFAGSEAQKKLGKTLIFGVEDLGRGQVIYMVDNPLFRGFWENGKLFFANALFMVN